jgi:hypothetical protein
MGALGAWRSLVARTVRVGEVPGSNPGAPIEMEEQERKPQEDERGARPPAGEGHGDTPSEGEEGEGAGSHGPLGNPASDEEALSQRQQEQDPPADE